MAIFLNLVMNVWVLARNTLARLRRAPDYILIEIGGSLPEFEERRSFLRRRFLPGAPAPISLEALRGRLDRILADGRPRGIVLRIRNLDAGWAAIEELRSEIGRFRERGGRVVAYLIECDTRAYYLACAADEILATPLATISILGLQTRVNFLKDALSKLGLEAEVFAVSPYKSAGDPLVRNDFSDEAREQAERLLSRRFDQLLEAVAQGRNLTPEEVRAKIDAAPYAAPSAREAGLLDGVCYEDELPERLDGDEGQARLAEWGRVRKVLRAPYRRRFPRRVGMVRLSGVIVRGRSRRLPVPLPLVGAEQAGDESVVGALRIAEKNRRIAAVLFYVDSRGGDALASDLIWREVERIRAKKPVVVLMGDTAASGGYYVSAAASRIIARQNTITGSIGVVLTRPVTSGLFDKIGVNPVTLGRGARSSLFDATHKPSPDEISALGEQLRATYAEFKNRVSNGRELDAGALEGIAGGRVWTGAEALERGLVDEIGGFRAAFDRARELAGISTEDTRLLLRISPPTRGRPAPGKPADALAEAAEDIKSALTDLRSPRVWAAGPYEISDGW